MHRPELKMICINSEGLAEDYYILEDLTRTDSNLQMSSLSDCLHKTLAKLKSKGLSVPESFRGHSDKAPSDQQKPVDAQLTRPGKTRLY